MADYNFEKLVKKLKNLSLSEEERDKLKTDFLARTGISNEPPNIFYQRKYNILVYIFSSLVLACLAAVVYVSNYALPGDMLYPVKTHVEEQLVLGFHDESPVSKAEYEVQLVDVRFQEAEDLNDQNPLTQDQKTDLKAKIMGQTAVAEEVIKTATSTEEQSEMQHLKDVFQKHSNMYHELNGASSTDLIAKPDTK